MKLLATRFNRDGFDCAVVKRVGDVVLVQVLPKHFEVARVQKIKAHTWPDGRTTPAHEAMPTNSQWGSQGWSFMDRGQAEAKFSELAKITQAAA